MTYVWKSILFSSGISSFHTTSARSLRLCIETGDVVSAISVLSKNTLTSGGDDDARSGRRLVSSYCFLLVIDVLLQQETLSRAVCHLILLLGGGF